MVAWLYLYQHIALAVHISKMETIPHFFLLYSTPSSYASHITSKYITAEDILGILLLTLKFSWFVTIISHLSMYIDLGQQNYKRYW